MYVVKHALKNLLRNKSRNVLLGVIIFVIITAVTVTLTLFSTSAIVISETRYELERMVRVVPMHVIYGEDMLSIEQFQFFAESEYLNGADIKENHTGINGIEAIYYLKHPDVLYDFEMELRNKGLPDNYSVVSEEKSFENVAGHLENLHKLTLTFLIIVLALGVLILVLLSIISINERKYEIGVLRAMGMDKKKVALFLWIEIIVITCICFILGIGAGRVLSQPVSDMILHTEVKSTYAESTSLTDRLEITTDVEEPMEMNVFINIVTVIQIFGISIFMVSIAGIVSIRRINKFEPLKILIERN